MKKAIKMILLALGFLIILVTTTQPATLPSLVLIVPFLLLFLILTLLFALFLAWRSRKGMQFKNIRSGMFAAALPTLLLVLRSLGQLTVRDVLIICILFGISYFYLLRMRSPAV